MAASVNAHVGRAREIARDCNCAGPLTVSYDYTVTPPGTIAGETRVGCGQCARTYPLDMSRVVVSASEACNVRGGFSVAAP
jgi:hypothetical protein